MCENGVHVRTKGSGSVCGKHDDLFNRSMKRFSRQDFPPSTVHLSERKRRKPMKKIIQFRYISIAYFHRITSKTSQYDNVNLREFAQYTYSYSVPRRHSILFIHNSILICSSRAREDVLDNWKKSRLLGEVAISLRM